jgi:hypothetical protein
VDIVHGNKISDILQLEFIFFLISRIFEQNAGGSCMLRLLNGYLVYLPGLHLYFLSCVFLWINELHLLECCSVCTWHGLLILPNLLATTFTLFIARCSGNLCVIMGRIETPVTYLYNSFRGPCAKQINDFFDKLLFGLKHNEVECVCKRRQWEDSGACQTHCLMGGQWCMWCAAVRHTLCQSSQSFHWICI